MAEVKVDGHYSRPFWAEIQIFRLIFETLGRPHSEGKDDGLESPEP